MDAVHDSMLHWKESHLWDAMHAAQYVAGLLSGVLKTKQRQVVDQLTQRRGTAEVTHVQLQMHAAICILNHTVSSPTDHGSPAGQNTPGQTKVLTSTLLPCYLLVALPAGVPLLLATIPHVILEHAHTN